jgi:hypothetical protein
MLSLTRESQLDKVKRTMRDVASYADEVGRDERLRADIRAAIGHGTKAGDQLKRDIEAGGITKRLEADTKLRKNLRAFLDDLDSAGERIRRKKSHRLRKALVVLAAAAAAIAVAPIARRWLQGFTEPASGVTPADMRA